MGAWGGLAPWSTPVRAAAPIAGVARFARTAGLLGVAMAKRVRSRKARFPTTLASSEGEKWVRHCRQLLLGLFCRLRDVAMGGCEPGLMAQNSGDTLQRVFFADFAPGFAALNSGGLAGALAKMPVENSPPEHLEKMPLQKTAPSKPPRNLRPSFSGGISARRFSHRGFLAPWMWRSVRGSNVWTLTSIPNLVPPVG
jgi:hypothetical protein